MSNNKKIQKSVSTKKGKYDDEEKLRKELFIYDKPINELIQANKTSKKNKANKKYKTSKKNKTNEKNKVNNLNTSTNIKRGIKRKTPSSTNTNLLRRIPVMNLIYGSFDDLSRKRNKIVREAAKILEEMIIYGMNFKKYRFSKQRCSGNNLDKVILKFAFPRLIFDSTQDKTQIKQLMNISNEYAADFMDKYHDFETTIESSFPMFVEEVIKYFIKEKGLKSNYEIKIKLAHSFRYEGEKPNKYKVRDIHIHIIKFDC